MPEHGGRLIAAAREYGIPAEEWLDLSTGISPFPWPVPEIPPECWRRLPEEEDGLREAARRHYGAPHVLPVAGTQAAIQALPRLRTPGRVAVLQPTYSEHAHAWSHCEHTLLPWHGDAVPEEADVLVVVNPNNPTGRLFPAARLLEWHAVLAARGGWLVVDEAFVDPTPEASLAPHGPREGLIVLRGLGKFYGLAGARIGFVLSTGALVAALGKALGPWPVGGPTRWVAQRVLTDGAWYAPARERLAAASARLARLLATHALAPNGGTALFQWVRTPHAGGIYRRLARRGILARQFTTPAGLRFGLPATETGWNRLERALAESAR